MTAVEQRLGSVFADAGATGFLYAKDLATGAAVGLRADEPVVAASVFKVPILLEVCLQIAAGRREATERIRVPARRRTVGPTGISALCDDVELSLRDLATLMIAVSDNTATDVLLDLVGLDAVNATLAEQGLARTVLVENCRDLIDGVLAAIGDDGLARLSAGSVDPAVLAGLRALDPARTNRTTARETGELLARIWRDEAGPAAACAQARRILGLQVWPHRLRSGFPGSVTVSGKTGTLPGVRNEAGVVEYDDGGRYVVAVFTRASTWDDPRPAIDASIGTAARIAVEHLRDGHCRRAPKPGDRLSSPHNPGGTSREDTSGHEEVPAMTMALLDATGLPERLEALTAELGVPGAAVGVLVGDELTVCTVGWTKLGPDGAPVTEDTLFLIGSITKVWTATLVMQLVDEGRIELDEPVNRYLNPPLRLADAAVADAVTVRQLLTHTGGFYGDADEPPYRDDDAVERTVAGYADLPQLHRIGSLFSYSNAGYNVLGRLIECLTGQTWDDALRDRLIVPLGLTRATTLPERAMVHRVAVGHERLAGRTELTPVTEWMVGRGSGPCGSSLATTAAELLAFGRMHLRDGLTADGTRVLSEASARAMREPLVRMVDPTFGDAWGLGWEVPRATDPVVIGHGGNTDGQESQLFLVPDRDLALCVLTNGDVTGRIREKLSDELLAQYAGVTVSTNPKPAPPGTTVDPSAFLGTFGRRDLRFTFRTAEDGGLSADCATGGEIEKYVTDFTAPLTYSAGTTFLLTIPGYEEHPQALTFVREDGGDGPATHVAMSGRVLPRLTEGGSR